MANTTSINTMVTFDNETSWEKSHGLEYSVTAVQIIFCVLMIFFSIIGLIGNALIIGTIAFVRQLRTTRNMFLINLATLDLVLIVIIVPFNVLSVIVGPEYWEKHKSLCIFVASVCAPGCLVAIWSNAGIAVNRYFFICHNTIYDKFFSPMKTAFWVVAIWALAFLIHLPNHLGWGQNAYQDKFFFCCKDTVLWSYSTFFSALGIVVPLLLAFFCYFRIYALVRTSVSARNNIVRAADTKIMVTDADDAEAPEKANNPNKAAEAFRQEVLLIKTLFRTFAVFVLSFLPLATLLMLPGVHAAMWIYLVTVFLAHGSTASASVMYYVTNESFRQGFRTLVVKTFGGKMPQRRGPATSQQRTTEISSRVHETKA